MIVLLKRYRGHVIKVVRNNYGPGSHEYEWRIRGPNKLNDQTSWMSRDFTRDEVKIEVDQLLPHKPRKFQMKRGYTKCVNHFNQRTARVKLDRLERPRRRKVR
jgi:hypothetical protein